MNEINYLDPEQFNNTNDKLDFKFILMRQIDKVRIARSTEMRGGYWEDKIISVAGGHGSTQVYFPDTRETFINSVKNLRSLLIPYWDDVFFKQEEKLDELDNKLREEEKKRIQNIDSLDEKDKKYHLHNEKGFYKNEFLPNRKVDHYENIFEVLLKLCQRAKLIGGNNMVSDEV